MTLETAPVRLIGSGRGPPCASQSSRTSTATGTPSRRCSPTSRTEGVDEIWCLGDIVGYGPQPNRCVEEARVRLDLCLLGNHDLAALGEVDLATFSPDAATSARWTIDVLERRRARLPEDARAEGRARRRRALPREPARPGLGVRAQRAGRARGARADERRSSCSSGTATSRSRSGSPTATRSPAVSPRAAARSSSTRGAGCSTPGSVGQPRDGDPRAAYLLSTSRRRRRTSAACRTTSRRPRPRSARRACPRRSPSGSTSASTAGCRVRSRRGHPRQARHRPRPLPGARALSTRRSTAAATGGCSPTCRRSRSTRRLLHALGAAGGACDARRRGRRRARRRARRGRLAVLRAVRRPRHHRRPLAAGASRRRATGCATSARRGPNLECVYGGGPGRHARTSTARRPGEAAARPAAATTCRATTRGSR